MAAVASYAALAAMPQAAISGPMVLATPQCAGRSCHSRGAAYDDTSARAVAALAFCKVRPCPRRKPDFAAGAAFC